MTSTVNRRSFLGATAAAATRACCSSTERTTCLSHLKRPLAGDDQRDQRHYHNARQDRIRHSHYHNLPSLGLIITLILFRISAC